VEKQLAALVQDKVAALQSQIDRYNAEAQRLKEAEAGVEAERGKVAEERAALAKERETFKSWRDAEHARFEGWKAEVTAKLEKERRVAVRQAHAAAAAARALPDRQERTELDALKTQVTKLRADVAAGETRYKATVERHRTATSQLQDRIAELEALVKRYEEERIAVVFGAGGVGAAPPSESAGHHAAAVGLNASHASSASSAGAAGGRRGSAGGGAAPAPAPAAPRRSLAGGGSGASAASGGRASSSSGTRAGGVGAARGKSAEPNALPRVPRAPTGSASSVADSQVGRGSGASTSRTLSLRSGAAGDGPHAHIYVPPPPPTVSGMSSASIVSGYSRDAPASDDDGPAVNTPSLPEEGGEDGGSARHEGSSGVGCDDDDELGEEEEEEDSASAYLDDLLRGAGANARSQGHVRPGVSHGDMSLAAALVDEDAYDPARYGGAGQGRGGAAATTTTAPGPALRHTIAAAETAATSSASIFAPPAPVRGGGSHAQEVPTALHMSAVGGSASSSSSSGGRGHPAHAAPHAATSFSHPTTSTASATSALLQPAPPSTSATVVAPAILSSAMRLHLASRVPPSALGFGVQDEVGHDGRPVPVISQRDVDGGKVEMRFADGTRVVRFRNGTEKESRPDGTSIVRFSNGDVKRASPASGVRPPADIYYYHSAGTVQTSYAAVAHAGTHVTVPGMGGMGGGSPSYEVFEFPSGQVELHWSPEGGAGKEISFPNGTVRVVDGRTGDARSTFPDGRTVLEPAGTATSSA
jgi:hypothetical protein